MTAKSHATTKFASPVKANAAPKDAIALLKADHEAVSQLFDEYEANRTMKTQPPQKTPAKRRRARPSQHHSGAQRAVPPPARQATMPTL